MDDRRAQCPVTETVDSLRIIIADWADEGRGKKGGGGISLRAHAALNGSLSSTHPPQLSSAQQLPRIRKLEQIQCDHPKVLNLIVHSRDFCPIAQAMTLPSKA